IPSALCQSNILIFDNGTLTPDASAPTTFIHTAYHPVSKPIMKGNVSSINPGSNTVPKEIGTPISAVPRDNELTPVNDRRPIPTAKITIEDKIVLSIPNRVANFGEIGEIKAKAIKGSVVIVPITVFDTPKLSRMAGISDPTEVSGSRKLEAISKIPAKR